MRKMQDEKERKSKVGPREAQLRAMREARMEANEKIVAKNTKAMNRAFGVKDVPHQTKTRGKLPKGKKTVVQFKKPTGRGR